MNRADVMQKVYQNRTDLSTFLVHLTKHPKDQNDTGLTAKQTFDAVLQTTPRKLIAKNPVGLFCKHPNDQNFPDPSQKSCFNNFLKVVCLTESPLDQIKHFIGEDFERDSCTLKYSEYGFVFTREFIQQRGGNPCFYVCTQDKLGMKSAFLSLFDYINSGCGWEYTSIDTIPADSPFRILPFVNIFGKKSSGDPMDYFWEREWRVPSQELKFNDQDIALALCPEEETDTYKERFCHITFVSPKWSLSKMIEKILQR